MSVFVDHSNKELFFLLNFLLALISLAALLADCRFFLLAVTYLLILKTAVYP